jgi:predicted DNA-binding protein (MmcQ/YjbR family)
MSVEFVRRYCLALPHATETVQWGDNLVFKIGGKMFAIVALEPGDVWISFKCALEEFDELTERPGIIPAPYLSRVHWVALEVEDALPIAELKRLLRQSYEIVRGKLPRKAQDELPKAGAGH